MNIELDAELGVNPHLGMCPKCGKDNGEILMIGQRKTKLKCNNCESVIYGHRRSEPCPKCGERDNFTHWGSIEEHDKIPTSLCSDCLKEREEQAKLVAEGGIYFKCAKCSTTGVVLKHAGLAKAVRKQMKIKAPAPCGVQFESCEEHTVTEAK